MTDESVFAAALAIGSPADRARFLDRACAGNPELRREVEELLAAHGRSNALDQPPRDLRRTGAYEAQTDDSCPTAAVGDRIGSYKLLERIGEGGMGEVWVADQLEPIKRRVALKLIKPGMDSRSVLARFEAERQALAVMDHPNIAKVLDAGTTQDGRPYFVMELVKGTPITEFCDARKLTPRERLKLFIPVCQAIQHAHQKGIIHRDIKPSNVLVALHDETPVPKVIDFGVAKAIGHQLTEKTIYTAYGALIGTPAYMAPEQATFNQLDVDTRADVYALGVLLYELLAGSTPVEPERLKKAALDEVIRIVRDEEPPRPSQRLSTSQAKATIAATRQSDPAKLTQIIRGELDWIAMKALEKDRTRRYDSAAALAKDVERYLAGDAVEACPPTLGYRLRKAYRRNRLTINVAAAFVVLATGAAIGGTLLAIQAKEAERRANDNATSAAANEGTARQAEAAAAAQRDLVARANHQLRLTSYAAEMNLLQAAYEAGDFARVKQLLEAQAPADRELDVRGPEWDYWNRKFHSYEEVLSIPCPPGSSRVGAGWQHAVAFCPDGRTVALGIGSGDGSLSLRFWDLIVRRQVKEIIIPPAPGQKPSRVATYQLKFSKDGLKLLIQRSLSLWKPPISTTVGVQHWLVELRAESLPVLVQEMEGAFVHEFEFSDNLEYSVESRSVQDQPENKGEIIFTVHRVSDRSVAGQVKVPASSSIGCQARVTDNGQHVLVSASSLPQRTFSFWDLGATKPRWEQRLDTFSNGIPRLDGGVYRQVRKEEGMWILQTRDLESNRLLGSMPLTTFDQGLTHFGPLEAWELSPDGRQCAFAYRGRITVRDFPAQHPNDAGDLLPFSSNPFRNPPVFEHLDAYTHNIAILADGRLAAAWTPFDYRIERRSGLQPADPDRIVVRVWPLQTGRFDPESAYQPVAVSPSGRRFAFLLRVSIGVANQPNRDQLLVVDADGRNLFKTNVKNRGSYKLRFSADDRYLCSLGLCPLDGDDVDAPPFVVWDYREAKIITRVEPGRGLRFSLSVVGMNEWEQLLSPDGARIILPVSLRDQRGIFSPILSGGRVLAFPSGGFVCDLHIPPGLEIRTLAFADDGIRGNRLTNVLVQEGSAVRVHHWDAETGLYRSETDEVLKGRYPVGSAAERRIERGERVVRFKADPSSVLSVDGYRAEVFDARRQGPDDKPLFVHETASVCELSPDGRRLMVRTRFQPSHLLLLCTSTGRQLLTLPATTQPGINASFGSWNSDGTQFRYGLDADGKPVIWDFRPLEAGK